MKKFLILLSLCCLMLVSCSSEQKADQQATTTEATGSLFETMPEGVELDGKSVTLAGITFTPPTTWNDLGPSGMRKANYTFDAVEGEGEAGSVAVYYFGKDQGGTVEANLDRWASQIGSADTTKSDMRMSLTVDGMTVSTIEVGGAYNSSMGTAMDVSPDSKANYRLLGAVVEGPEGNVFFKLTGPDKTALGMAQGFVTMIQSLHK